MKKLVRFGLGGKQGKGNQMFSWIHIDDIYQIILFIINHQGLEGVFNCSAPHPVTNEMMMRSLRKAMHVSAGLPAPEWLLKIGAVLIHTETELILKSRWVLPQRLLESGYVFSYPSLQPALKEICES